MTFREIYAEKLRQYEEKVREKPHQDFLAEVADKAGVTTGYLQQLIYRENLLPGLKTALRISVAVGIPAGVLFPGLFEEKEGKEEGHVS